MSTDYDMQMVLAAVGLAIVGSASIPGLLAIRTQARHATPKDNFYEDVDGKSTPEAVADFSNKKPKGAIVLLSVAALATSVAISVLASLNLTRHHLFLQNWLTTAAFVRLNSNHFCAICFAGTHAEICLAV